jgi:hypothetical protein
MWAQSSTGMHTIKYGPAEQPYKKYLETMNKCIQMDCLTRNSRRRIKRHGMQGYKCKSGAVLCLQGGGMGNYLNIMYGKGTSFDLIGFHTLC